MKFFALLVCAHILGEYVLIGTLLSFTLAIALAYLTSKGAAL